MKLRILSYNIHRAIGLDRRFKPDRVEKIIRSHNPDIVLLQEVDEGVPRSRGLDMGKDIAANLSYPYYVVGHNVSLRKGRYGNATLSRFPILRDRNIDLTIGARKCRGCQHTTVQIEQSPEQHYLIEVFNLHLGLSTLERQRQAGILLRSNEFSGIEPGTLCIIGGDFNDWPSQLRALFVEGMAMRCATDTETQARTKALKTYPSFSPRAGLDRIYYSGRMQLISAKRCNHQMSKIASDHLPIIADFELLTGDKSALG